MRAHASRVQSATAEAARRTRLGVSFLVLATACSCATGTARPPEPRDPTATYVLFLGNSYLYYNDIPGIVEALSDSAGRQKIRTNSVARPDVALVDHLMRASVLREIEDGQYHIVVLQQGPSSTVVNRDSLRLVTRRFSPLVRTAGGRPALFSAWPSRSRWFDVERAMESYRLAAEDVAGLYLPVADAWVAARERDRNVPLYADELHPTTTGAYLSALVIYARITGQSPIGLPARVETNRGIVVGIEPDVARMLQEVAATVTRTGDSMRGSADYSDRPADATEIAGPDGWVGPYRTRASVGVR